MGLARRYGSFRYPEQVLHLRRETVLIFGEILSPVETAVTSSVFPSIPVTS